MCVCVCVRAHLSVKNLAVSHNVPNSFCYQNVICEAEETGEFIQALAILS